MFHLYIIYFIHVFTIGLLWLSTLAKSSITTTKRRPDSAQPCRTPRSRRKKSDAWPLCSTQLDAWLKITWKSCFYSIKTQNKHELLTQWWRKQKEFLHFDDQSKEVVSFFPDDVLLKEIENMSFVFLSSYGNTRKSLGKLEKLSVEALAHGSCSNSLSRSPKLSLMFL